MSVRRTVVIPAYTCPLVALAVARAGMRVRLCDTAPDRFDLDPGALHAVCDDDTLCIVPTHLGGAVANLEPVLDVAVRRDAYVIEDAAQALGATWRGRPVGTIGDAGFYSLARGKGLTLFEGGVLVAREPSFPGRFVPIPREATARVRRALPPRRASALYREPDCRSRCLRWFRPVGPATLRRAPEPRLRRRRHRGARPRAARA